MTDPKPLGDADVIGHDLKSPLGTVISVLEVLRETVQLEDDVNRLMSDALQAAYHQNSLIENLVDYLRLRAGEEFDLKLTPLDVASLLSEVQTRMTDRISRKNIAVSYEIPSRLPLVRTDRILLVRVMMAVIENSLKFCTSQDEIRVEVQPEQDHIFILVKDTGRAVVPAYAELMFEPTRQMEARLANSRTSLALNLPFARLALQLIGGDISATTTDGWTTFAIALPIA